MHRTARPTAAVLALTALLAVAACGGGGDDGGDGAAATTATTAPPTSAAGGGETGDDLRTTDETAATAPGGEGSGPAPGGTTAPAGAAAGSTGDPAADGAAVPAPPGRFVYDVDGTITFSGPTPQSRPLPPEARLTVDPPAGERQRSVREATDDEGNGSISETVLVYATDGVHLESLKLTTRVGTFSDVREFRPASPPIVVPASPQPGDRTEFWMQTTDRRITVQVTVTVVGTERVTIGGTETDTLVLDMTSTFSGDIEGETASRSWNDRTRSLMVKEHSESDVRVGVNEAHSEYDAVLRSLTPS